MSNIMQLAIYMEYLYGWISFFFIYFWKRKVAYNFRNNYQHGPWTKFW